MTNETIKFNVWVFCAENHIREFLKKNCSIFEIVLHLTINLTHAFILVPI